MSLGIESIKNETYQQIARGFHESSSDTVLFTIVLVITLGGFLIAGQLVSSMHSTTYPLAPGKSNAFDKKETQDLDELGATAQMLQIKIDRTANDIALLRDRLRRITKRLKVSTYISIGIQVIVAALIVLIVFRSLYVNAAITHFNQAFAIACPYMDTQEEEARRAEFAQVASKDDYVKLLDRIEGVAAMHGDKLPAFDAW